MKAKELIEKHRIPCAPASINADAVCRRRLRDQFDALLDRLTELTHPSGVDEEILEMEEQVDLPEGGEQEETEDEIKKRLIREGKMKADVKKVVKKYEDKIMPKPKTSDHAEPENSEEDEDQGNSRLLQRIDGKMTRWQGKG